MLSPQRGGHMWRNRGPTLHQPCKKWLLSRVEPNPLQLQPQDFDYCTKYWPSHN
uniref:Uncharacterized protein n=1 Tax=Rhizophora mucronata TaxID=61149 RepID=A0A2P2K3E7_RHIMU